MSEEKNTNLRDRLRGIAGLLPSLQAAGVEFGTWKKPASAATSMVRIPYVEFTRTANSFIQAAYDYDWVLTEFDWGEWLQTSEAESLSNDPRAVAPVVSQVVV